MGVAASIAEQRNLFESLKVHHELLFPKNNANSEDNESDTRDSDKLTAADKVIDDNFMEKAQQIYGSWCHTVALKKNTLFCELTDFEDTLGDAFRSELTPFFTIHHQTTKYVRSSATSQT